MPGQFNLSDLELKLILKTDASQLAPWQRQIKEALTGVQQQAQATTQAVQQATQASFGGSSVQTIQNTSGAIQVLEQQTGKANSTIGQFSRGVASGVLGLSLLGGGALLAGRAITEFVTSSIDDFHKLESEAQNLSTVQVGLNVEQAEQSLQRLQSEVPATLKDISEAYYEVASVGGQTAEATEELTRRIATGAATARAETKGWTDDVVGSMNQFGLWGQTVQETYANADKVQAEFFQAAKDSIGTPQQLAQAWGPVALAVQQAGGTMEEALALMVAASRGAGSFQQNMTNLQRFLNDLNTDKARAALEAYGVAVQNADGSSRSAIEILTQLNDKLDGLSQGQKAAVLEQLFPNERSTRGVENLLNNLDKIPTALANLQNAGKGWSDAQNGYLDTAAAKTKELENRFLAFKEELGKNIDPVRIVFKFVAEQNDPTSGVPGTYKVDTGGTLSPNALPPGPAAGIPSAFAPLQLLGPALSQAGTNPLKAVSDAIKQVGKDTADAQPVVKSFTDMVKDLGTTATTAFAQAKAADASFSDDLKQNSATVHAQLQTVQEAIKGFAEGFKVSLQQMIGEGFVDEAFGHLPSDMQALFARAGAAAKQSIDANFSQVVSTMAQYAGQIQALYNQMLSPSVSEADKKKFAQQIQDILNQASQYATQNQDYLDPAGAAARAQRRADAQHSLDDLDAQDKINAKQKELNDLRDQDAAKIDAIKDKLKAQNELLRQANIELYNTKKYWDDIAYTHEINLQNLQKEKDAALGTSVPGAANATGLTKQLQDDTTALEAYTQSANDQLHDLDQQLYNLQKAARETTVTLTVGFDEAGNAITKTVTVVESLEERLKESSGYNKWTYEVKQAQQALDDLNRAAEYQRQVFQDDQNAIDDATRAVDDKYRAAIAEATAEVQAFNQALSDLNHQEELELRPLEDSIYALNQRLQTANDRLQTLQTQLNKLRELDRQAQAEEDLRNRALSVQNLRGQLVGATGARRAGLQDQLNRQEASLGRAEEENTLQQQIAAQQQVVDGVQKEIEAQRQAEEAIRRKYELESRAIKDNLYNAQRRLDQLNNERQQELDLIAIRQRAHDEQVRQFERQQENTRRQIQETLDWYKEEQQASLVTVTLGMKHWQDLYNSINNTRTNDTNYFSEREREMQQMVNNDKLLLSGEITYWDGLIGKEQAAAKEDENVGKAAVKAAQDTVDKLTAPDGPIATLQAQIDKESDVATAAEKSKDRQIQALKDAKAEMDNNYNRLKDIKQLYDDINAQPVPGTPPTTPPTAQSGQPNAGGYPGTSSGVPPTPPSKKSVGDYGNPFFTQTVAGVPSTTPARNQGVPVAASPLTNGQPALIIYGNVEVQTPLPTSQADVARFASVMRANLRPAAGRGR